MTWSPTPEVVVSHRSEASKPIDLVSVCVSAFQYERYIVQALDSVVAQTHAALEVVVVDDASETDGTREVAAEWIDANHGRFWSATLLANRRNQGPSLTRNVAFARASGDFVFVLDADNEIYPRAIAELHRTAVDGAFDAVYCQIETFGLKRQLGVADVFDALRMRESNYVDVMALIARAAWARLGGFSHLELGWEDYDFWLKFIDAGFSAGFLPEILCRYRVHGVSRSDKDALPSHEHLRDLMAIRHPTPVAPPIGSRTT